MGSTFIVREIECRQRSLPLSGDTLKNISVDYTV